MSSEKFKQSRGESVSFVAGYRRILGKRKMRFELASNSDFLLDDGLTRPCPIIDFVRFTPYAFQYETDSFFFVDTPRQALKKPFFYLAQFELASQALIIERSELSKTLGGIESARTKKPTFVFSIGRCGSTLLSQLAGVAGMAQLSEPDIFTGIVRRHGDSRVREVIGDAFLALERFLGVSDDEILIKLRSQNCGSAGHFLSVFPDARYILLKRDLREWAASYISKFGWQAENLRQSLTMAYRAYRMFSAANANLTVIDYATLAHDPVSVAEQLCGVGNLSASAKHAIDNLMSRDSQAGAGIRVKSDRHIVDRSVEAFLEDWMCNADSEMQEFFGVDE